MKYSHMLLAIQLQEIAKRLWPGYPELSAFYYQEARMIMGIE